MPAGPGVGFDRVRAAVLVRITSAVVTVSTCGLTRVVVPAFLVGFTVSAITTSDPLGWIAASLTAAAILVVGRILGTSRACPVPAGAGGGGQARTAGSERPEPRTR